MTGGATSREQPGAKKQALIFLLAVFGLSWIGLLVVYLLGYRFGSLPWSVAVTLMQFLPALTVLGMHLVHKASFSLSAVGMQPNFKGNVLWYLLSYFLPSLLTFLAAALFFCIFRDNYDPAGSVVVGSLMENGQTREQAESFLHSQVLISILGGPILSLLNMFLEELGFRGFLLPRIEQLFRRDEKLKSAVVTGALWSLWYAPLYAQGYHYGADHPGAPWVGMLLGFLYGFLMSFLLSFLTFRTGSVFPAALLRSGMDSLAAAPLFYTQGTTSLLLGPSSDGLMGCVMLLPAAALCVWGLYRMDHRSLILPE